MKKILVCGLITGLILFVVSYGGLYLAVRFFPMLFVESYANNPLINSDGIKGYLFFTHAFVISFALSWFWDRFKNLLKGNYFMRGAEFGLIYAAVCLLPIMWITYSALDVTLIMVLGWLLYGSFQAIVAGIVFARINP